MGDLASDHDAAISLIIDEYRRLQKHDSNHKLLKYLSKVENDGIAYAKDEKIIDEFLDKYAPKEENTPTAVMLARYFIDLRETVDKIEGIDRSSLKPQKTLEEKFKQPENLPF